jgi:UDP-N-acetylmuramate: L-alanyl-gamma-D-glutamyl-meso-diaminopimelate ligase
LSKLYFIRVGGTAMGSVAAALGRQGCQVSGSEEDLYEPMKSYLAEAGVRVIHRFDPANLAEVMPNVVVVGNAVSRGNPELEAALNQRLPLTSLPQLVAEKLIDRNLSLVVAGTHGKTTTTAMLAWLLEQAGRRPGWMIGGVPKNLPESCRPVPPDLHNTEQGIFVIEGDEYDCAYWDKRSKFLWYRPHVAILNNLELDHTDIFATVEDIQKSFRLLLRTVPQNGLALVKEGDRSIASFLNDAVSPVQSFGMDAGDWQVRKYSESAQGSMFEIWRLGMIWASITLSAPGEHNALNFLAACAAAAHIGLTGAEAEAGAATFRLPKRRMEWLGKWRGADVVDDFAHHPTAIHETIKAATAAYPGQKIFAAFEPRSNSTTRSIFQKELGECFEGAAGVFFGPLDRPARFSEKERLDTEALTALLRSQGIEAEALGTVHSNTRDWGALAKKWLAERVESGDLVLLLSNGDLGGLRALLKGNDDL